MAGPVFSNNATGTLAAAYSAAATSLTLTAGQGAKFPSPGAGEWFPATIVDNANNLEIVKVTARTADTLTVVRGQEGTAARAFATGDKLDHRLTAAAIIAIRDRPLDASQIPDLSVNTAKLADNSVTTPKIADNQVTTAKIAPGQIVGSHFAPGAIENGLGWTPVQQGGGAGQGGNKVYIGWTGLQMKMQVDTTDLGNLMTERHNGLTRTAGYRGIPTADQNNDYRFALTDMGRAVCHTGGTHNYVIPTDATPFERGTVLHVFNRDGAVGIIGDPGVVIVWVPSGWVGERLIGAPGRAEILKIDSNRWWVEGWNIS